MRRPNSFLLMANENERLALGKCKALVFSVHHNHVSIAKADTYGTSVSTKAG